MSQWNDENENTENVDENDSDESGRHDSDEWDECAGSNGEGDDDLGPPNGGSNSAAGPRDPPTWFAGPEQGRGSHTGQDRGAASGSNGYQCALYIRLAEEKPFSEAYECLKTLRDIASTTVESSLESLETSARCGLTTDDSSSDTDDSSVGSLDSTALSDVRQIHRSAKTRSPITDTLRSLHLGSVTSAHEAKVTNYNWMLLLATVRHQEPLILPAQLVPGLVLLQLLKACLRVEYSGNQLWILFGYLASDLERNLAAMTQLVNHQGRLLSLLPSDMLRRFETMKYQLQHPLEHLWLAVRNEPYRVVTPKWSEARDKVEGLHIDAENSLTAVYWELEDFEALRRQRPGKPLTDACIHIALRPCSVNYSGAILDAEHESGDLSCKSEHDSFNERKFCGRDLTTGLHDDRGWKELSSTNPILQSKYKTDSAGKGSSSPKKRSAHGMSISADTISSIPSF